MKKLLLILGVTVLLAGCNTKKTAEENISLQPGQVAGIEQQTTPESNLALDSKTPDSDTAITQLLEIHMVVLKTSKGDITLELYPDQAPKTVQNFLEKAKSGYYEGLTFHRVEDWVVQGGDPEGTGRGGGTIPTELNQVQFAEGSLGVARGPQIQVSNDSQFFICTKDCGWLTGQYTNFGKVVKGMEVVKQMQVGDKIVGIEVTES